MIIINTEPENMTANHEDEPQFWVPELNKYVTLDILFWDCDLNEWIYEEGVSE